MEGHREQLVAGVAEQARDRAVGIKDRPPRIEHQHPDPGALENRAEALFALPQRRFQPLALGDVEQDAVPGQGMACLVPQQRGPIVHPDPGPVVTAQTVFEIEVVAGVSGMRVPGAHRLDVVRVDAGEEGLQVPFAALQRQPGERREARAGIREAAVRAGSRR